MPVWRKVQMLCKTIVVTLPSVYDKKASAGGALLSLMRTQLAPHIFYRILRMCVCIFVCAWQCFCVVKGRKNICSVARMYDKEASFFFESDDAFLP